MTEFSVVIPLYNKRAFVRAAVESVLSQNCKSFELIVVDDGSTDGSAEILTDIADQRLRIVAQPNAGVAAARNRGIKEATGEWVALLDADDAWKPMHLTELSAIIATCPDSSLIATTVQQVRSGRLLDSDRAEARRIRKIDYFAEAAFNILIIHTSAAAVRRDLVQRIGGFRDLRPGQDIDCWSRMALEAPVAISNQQTALYTRDTGGAMAIWAGKARTRSNITRLDEFGGAVQSLAKALATGRYEDRRTSIEHYIDARILSGVRKCLVSGDQQNARNRLRFVHHLSREYLSYKIFTLFPGGLIKNVLALIKHRRGA